MASRFSRPVLAAIDEAKLLAVRAGERSDHRFIGIWAVVVDGRVYARSWAQRAGGWYETLADEKLGAIRIGEREVRMRAARPRGTRIHEAIERAYAAKYTTPGSLKFVRGFRTARRRKATLELLPR